MLCVGGGRSAHLQDGYLARWDYWARESQLLHATVPTITTPGNHEVGGGLQAGGHGVPAQTTSCEVAQCLASPHTLQAGPLRVAAHTSLSLSCPADRWRCASSVCSAITFTITM